MKRREFLSGLIGAGSSYVLAGAGKKLFSQEKVDLSSAAEARQSHPLCFDGLILSAESTENKDDFWKSGLSGLSGMSLLPKKWAANLFGRFYPPSNQSPGRTNFSERMTGDFFWLRREARFRKRSKTVRQQYSFNSRANLPLHRRSSSNALSMTYSINRERVRLYGCCVNP